MVILFSTHFSFQVEGGRESPFIWVRTQICLSHPKKSRKSHPQIWCWVPICVAIRQVLSYFSISQVQELVPEPFYVSVPDMNPQDVHDMSNSDLLRVLYLVLMEYLRRAGLYFRCNVPFALQFVSDPTVVTHGDDTQAAQPRTPPAYFLCLHKCHKEHCQNSCLSRSQAPRIHVCPCHLQVCDFVVCEQV